MTTSTNALLYYGFTFLDEDEEEPPWNIEDAEDSDEWLCNKLGGPKEPAAKYSEENKPQYHEYWEARRKFIKELPIMIDSHCYIDSPMHFICIQESHSSASRGYPVQLGQSCIGHSVWDDILREYCGRLSIKWQEPQWELASMWA